MMPMAIHLYLILWHPHQYTHRIIHNRSLFTVRISLYSVLFVILENLTAVLGNLLKILQELGYHTYVFQRTQHWFGIVLIGRSVYQCIFFKDLAKIDTRVWEEWAVHLCSENED